MLPSKEERIQDAANRVFLQYGYKRVTMNEIAEAVGISRPALYLSFGSKEEVFRALLERNLGRALGKIREGMERLPSPKEKLRFAFDVWAVQTFDLIRRSPEAKELYDSGFEFARDTMERGYAAFESLLVPQLPPTAGLTPEVLAKILSAAVRGFKQIAHDGNELGALIDDFLKLVTDER